MSQGLSNPILPPHANHGHQLTPIVTGGGHNNHVAHNNHGTGPDSPLAGKGPKAEEVLATMQVVSAITNFQFFLELLNDATAVQYEKDGLPKFHLDHEKKLPADAKPTDHQHQERLKPMRKWLSQHIAAEKKEFESKIGEVGKLDPQAEKAFSAHMLLEFIKIADAAAKELKLSDAVKGAVVPDVNAEANYKKLKAHKAKAHQELARIEEKHKKFLKPLTITAAMVKHAEHDLHIDTKAGEEKAKQNGSPTSPTSPGASHTSPGAGARRGSIDNGGRRPLLTRQDSNLANGGGRGRRGSNAGQANPLSPSDAHVTGNGGKKAAKEE